MPTKLLNGPTPNALTNRRSCLRDVLEVQGLVVERARKTKDGQVLSSLASALARLVPLVCALRGRPIFSASMTKRLDLTPNEVSRILKDTKTAKRNGITDIAALISDEPATTKTDEAAEPKPKDKGIS